MSKGWVAMMMPPTLAVTRAKPKTEPRLYPSMPTSEAIDSRGQSSRAIRKPPKKGSKARKRPETRKLRITSESAGPASKANERMKTGVTPQIRW